jgi:nitronate monooxygenase
MLRDTALMQKLGLRHPLIQAPMAGGGDTPALVAAVCEAGALGSVGAAYLTPEQIRETASNVRERTRRPFGINLFAPLEAPPPVREMAPALARLAPFFAELGLPPPSAPPAAQTLPFDEQLSEALDSGASVFSFTFGMLPPSAMAAIRAKRMLIAGTATTVDEAVALEKAGVDAVVVQGSEAGGHRGTFRGSFEQALIGTMALVPQVVRAVRVPVIASGGIMDGRGMVAALALGASAVQMGTAFLTCDEAGIPDAYKRAILAAREDQTRLTRAFSGRPARGIVNRFMEAVPDDAALPFPIQNALTRPMRSAAGKKGDASLLSLWAGQGLRMARREPARTLVERIRAEAEEALQSLITPP